MSVNQHYYTVPPNASAGLWNYYATYGKGENQKNTPSISFWITNPEISVIPSKDNKSATLNGTGFSPGGIAEITVTYQFADLAPGSSPDEKNIQKTVTHKVSIDKMGNFFNCCQADQGLPDWNRVVDTVVFSAIDLKTGYPSHSNKKIEVSHQFSIALFSQEVPPTALPPTTSKPSAGQIQIDATKGWQSTGIMLTQGNHLTIKVIGGQWTHQKGVAFYNNGVGNQNYICSDYMPANKCVEPLPGAPQGTLIGKIGNTIFEIDSSATITVQKSGLLFLRMNDGDIGLYDNDGVLTAQISISK